MHPVKKWFRLAIADPWYFLKGYPNGGAPSKRAVVNARRYLESNGVFGAIRKGESAELPPNLADLAFLHSKVVERGPRCVLEFGCGFSTLVIAHALSLNAKRPGGYQGRLYSVDSSKDWIENTRAKLAEELYPFVHISYSGVTIATHQGNICHLYDELPDVVPDFIYLDGPDPAVVKGEIHGLSFRNLTRTVMAADILLLESTLLPGSFIVVDGRTNNARFLARNLTRRYLRRWRRSADVTTFELWERKLGYKNIFGYE